MVNNGFSTPFFKLERGVRQGCPLSVYLFLLVVELLAEKIRGNSNIQGILLKNKEIKITQMADDTCIFLNSGTGIPETLKTLENFAICSGLKTNVEKTKAYNIGNAVGLDERHDLDWDESPMKL